jgi:Zn ribbon nucleic-acid-binding protein
MARSEIDEIDEAGRCPTCSNAVTAVKFSEEGNLDVSMDFACGLVIIGRSRRREASTYVRKDGLTVQTWEIGRRTS